jgi:SRSO17 transposase
VVADEVYGGHDLRTRIRELGYGYAVAVPASHRVTTPAGRFTASSLVARLPRRAWQRLRAGHGTKGDRHYDWAMIEVSPDDTPPGHDPGHSVLLVRRHRYTGELSFYRCHSTAPASLAGLVAVVCTRWRIEEDIRAAKSLTGLDHGQVTCWNSWIRWSLISLVAAALLAVALARTRSAGSPPATDLIPLTSPNCLPFCKPPSSAHRAATWRTPCTGHAGGAVTSTAQRSASADGTRSPPPYEHQLQDHDLQLP